MRLAGVEEDTVIIIAFLAGVLLGVWLGSLIMAYKDSGWRKTQ